MSFHANLLSHTRKYKEINKRSLAHYSIEFLSICTLIVLLFLLSPTGAPAVHDDSSNTLHTASSPSLPKTPSPTLDLLSNARTYQGMPVGEISSHPVDHALGTAILIPQFHHNPGTDPQEKINDAAETTQQQIYTVLQYLIEQHGIRMVMVEGEIFGNVSQEKIERLAKKIVSRDSFSAQCDTLEQALARDPLDPKTEGRLLNKLAQAEKEVDREIILKGAPLVLKAEGASLTLYGSENKKTQEASAKLIRNYIYLNDRAQELARAPRQQKTTRQLFSGDIQELLLQLLSAEGTDAAAREFSTLTALAQKSNNAQLTKLLKKTEDAFTQLQEQDNSLSINTATNKTPSRSENPYQNIRSEKEIQELLEDTEEQIDTLVLEQRNSETAENFSKALVESNENVGVLPFGAGHKEGLVRELNARGYSVVVVIPKEVWKIKGKDSQE